MSNVFAGVLPVASGPVTQYWNGTPANPGYITDGNLGAPGSTSDTGGGVVEGGPFYSRWTMDLGAVATITSATLTASDFGQQCLSLEGSADGAAWAVVISGPTFAAAAVGMTATVAIGATSYRYWRLVHTVPLMGLGTPHGLTVYELSAEGTIVPPDPGPIIRVYNPSMVLLATLGDAFDVQVRVEHNGTGSGKFSISRYSAQATAVVLTPGNYVRFTVPQIDPSPIFGFFLEAGDFKLVASDEQGGETISFGGRGGLAYWDRAIWLAESFLVPWWPAYAETLYGAPGPTQIGALAFNPGWYYRYTVVGGAVTARSLFHTDSFTSYYDTRQKYTRTGQTSIELVHLTTLSYAGYYVSPYGAGTKDYRKKSQYALGPSVLMSNLSANKRPGEVLYAMYGEAIAAARPIKPLPAMTVDFSATLDSTGAAWTVTDALDGVSAELGDDYLSTIGKLVNTGAIDVRMGPDLDMHAYNSYGTNRASTVFAAGKVRFVKGTNIADELSREYSDSPVGTFAEVVGNIDGAIARVTLASAAGRAPREIGVRGETGSTAALAALGTAELDARLLHSDAIGFAVATPIIGNEDELAGLYLPGPAGTLRGKYWIGDTVTLHTGTGEHDFNQASVRIAAITMSFSDAGDLRVVVEQNSGFGGYQPIGGSSGSSTSTTGGAGGGTASLSDLYQLASALGQPNGYPNLDDDGLLPFQQNGSRWKQPVRVVATANGTLATAYAAGQIVDGATLVAGDDILLAGQTAGADNGLYLVNATGAPSRRADFSGTVPVLGAVVLVREGTVGAGKAYRLTNTAEPTIGTTALTWTQVFAPPPVVKYEPLTSGASGAPEPVYTADGRFIMVPVAD